MLIVLNKIRLKSRICASKTQTSRAFLLDYTKVHFQEFWAKVLKIYVYLYNIIICES